MALTDRIEKRGGCTLVIKNGSLSAKLREQILAGMKEVSDQYMKQVDKTLSLDDHTLQELRRLGHPYGVEKPENTPHDDAMIHEQTGKLRKSISVTAPSEITSRKIGVTITSDDPVMPFLMYGTTRMRPRRFHERAYQNIKDKYWQPIFDRLKKFNYRIDQK